MILQEKEPQTLLLFSDENMAWLYEDTAFAARWAELFAQVLARGNRVRIVHTVSRNMNEMLEAVTKWVPIYMTGAVEPYHYPCSSRPIPLPSCPLPYSRIRTGC